MSSINVDGLPEPVIHSLEAMVNALKGQFAASEKWPPGEGLRRAAGAWADADESEFNHWLDETYRARRMQRPEPSS